MRHQRKVDEHFVVHELIALGCLQGAVEHKGPPVHHVVVVKPSKPKPSKHETENPVRASKHESENVQRAGHEPENPVARAHALKQAPEHPPKPEHAAKAKANGKSDGPKLQHEHPAKTIPQKPLPPVVTTAAKPDHGSGNGKKGATTTTTTTATTTATTGETPSDNGLRGNGNPKK